MAAKTHSPEVKEQVRNLIEVDGKTPAEVSRELGVPKQTISDWARLEGWEVPEVIRRVRIQEQRLVRDPVLDSALKRLEALPKDLREAEYDEAMHQVACSVGVILKQLPHTELVAKADKVAKLVDMAQTILGRQDAKRSAGPALSFNILASRAAPPPMQLADAEEVN